MCGLAAASLSWGERLLIVHKVGNSVGFYRSDTGESLATVPVGIKPHEVVLSADGRLAYVTNYGLDRYNEDKPGGNTISIIDVKAMKSVGEIDLGEHRRPHGIERGRSGKLYVTCDRPSVLLVVDPKQKKVERVIEAGLDLPHMVQLTDDEKTAYVSNAGNGTATVIALDGKKPPKQLAVGGVPMGFALTKDGKRLYATTRSANTVCVIDTASNEIVERIPLEGEPARGRLTPDGKRLLVSLIQAGDVAVLDTASLKVVKRFRAGTHAEGLSADPSGKVGYVSAQDDQKVIRFSLDDYRTLLEIKTGLRPDPILVLP